MRDLVLCHVRIVKKDEFVYSWDIEDAIAVVGDQHQDADEIAEHVLPEPTELDLEAGVVHQTSDGAQYKIDEDAVLVRIESTNPDGSVGSLFHDMTAPYVLGKDLVEIAKIGVSKIEEGRNKVALFSKFEEGRNDIRFFALFNVDHFETHDGDWDYKKEFIGSVDMGCKALDDAVDCRATHGKSEST
jgi:hypothetical protein